MTNPTHSTPQDAESAETDGCCNAPEYQTAPLRAPSLTTSVLCGSLFRWPSNAKRVAGFDWRAIARQHQQITVPNVDLQWFTRSESLLHQQPKTYSGSKSHQLPAGIVAISKSCLNLGVHIYSPIEREGGKH
jgi:hypothetical protein